MAEEVFNDIPEELHATILPREVSSDANDTTSLKDEEKQYLSENSVSVSRNQSSTTKSLSQLPSENGVSFGKILSFAGSCSINLVLPFINGLMLGFGELVAHEISWNWNWFNKSNNGYRIFPENRKQAATATAKNPSSNDADANDKFL
ncbi:mitochondrial import protein 1 [Kluyveromyces marxianus]|uniref:Mitochondrial import protein 1 n=2 Tax=Kluyveromyces marxianus TaxID=4911 RepID=W0TJ31_KLUMD|nr:mitochondrial import protein 1 [Kluyveromyces marxianus DMKU3-1042]QGN18304.1 mitochondrial import protein 1 [Kluyveromyces marxianus]BAO42169.1 mitochondrial import protein 1 [Kluyveromyces marxianus DMKU3-1042]BAP73577.1 mitochondrial import protein 1 [Kluyveromyces marxianus]